MTLHQLKARVEELIKEHCNLDLETNITELHTTNSGCMYSERGPQFIKAKLTHSQHPE